MFAAPLCEVTHEPSTLQASKSPRGLGRDHFDLVSTWKNSRHPTTNMSAAPFYEVPGSHARAVNFASKPWRPWEG